MSDDRSAKRRAVVTGLKPYMDDPLLTQALNHWEEFYANSPRFTLQKFVTEIARASGLQEQRSSMLLSLVKAMNMPAEELLPDPVRQRKAVAMQPSTRSANAFALFMTTLVEKLPYAVHRDFRADLLESIDSAKLPEDLTDALDSWLGSRHTLKVPPAPPLVLRALVNRAYILLCERLGPVEADKLLSEVINASARVQPDLAKVLTDLL